MIFPLLAEPMLGALLRRMPNLGACEIHQLVNCPESFTPDMRCLMGETPGVHGYFVLAGMNSSGVSFAGGAGRWAGSLVFHRLIGFQGRNRTSCVCIIQIQPDYYMNLSLHTVNESLSRSI